MSTYSLTSANWGQTLTLTCGAVKASTGTVGNSGQIGLHGVNHNPHAVATEEQYCDRDIET